MKNPKVTDAPQPTKSFKSIRALSSKETTPENTISKFKPKNYYSLKSCNFVTPSPKVGSYAQTSSSNSRPWTKRKIASTKPTKKRKVLYPILAECAALTTDCFWKDLFEKASFGKFIKGFTINRDYLIYKRGSKSDSVLIPNSPHEAYSVCVSFFQSSAKIYSDEDLKKIHEEERLMQLEEQLKERTWSKTRKRQAEVLIDDYICELKAKYHLGVEQGKKLEDLINIGLLYNYFNKDNIILKDGMISEIKSLKYDETKGEFTTITKMKPKTGKSSSKARRIEPSPLPRHIQLTNQRKIDFQNEWGKLLEQTCKNKPIREKKADSIPAVQVTRVASPLPSNSNQYMLENITDYTLTPTEVTDIISTLDS